MKVHAKAIAVSIAIVLFSTARFVMAAGGAASATYPYVEKRITATGQLAMERNPANKQVFLMSLQDPEPLVRHHCVYGLERLGDASAAKVIIPLLKDSDLMVRRAAAVALGKLKEREAVQPLIAALKDENTQMRQEIIAALNHIGDPAAVEPVIAAAQDRILQGQAGAELVHFLYQPFVPASSAAPLLKQLLEDNSARDEAAYVLARKCGDASVEDVLIKGLEGSDFAQQNSADALACIKSRKAIPALVKLMATTTWTTTRKHAAAALGDIGVNDKNAREELQKLLADENLLLRPVAAKALKQMGVAIQEPDLASPAAEIPTIPSDQLGTPGNKRPPQFICLAVDDNTTLPGLETVLDICETFQARDQKVVFSLWVAPLLGKSETRDMEKQKLIYQRLFDLGCEMVNHSLHHNPGGVNWVATPAEQQFHEIHGTEVWLRENVIGFTRCFSWGPGGGGKGEAINWKEISLPLIHKENYLYSIGKANHPDEQSWKFIRDGERCWYWMETSCIDGTAPPVHKNISEKLTGADFPGRYDYEVSQGVAMLKSNFEYHYQHPRRPVFAPHFHDWGLFPRDWGSIQNEGAILKAFLQDVLIDHRDQYPETHCVTWRQVLEYSLSDGDLAHTLSVGNCQDSRNSQKPIIP